MNYSAINIIGEYLNISNQTYNYDPLLQIVKVGNRQEKGAIEEEACLNFIKTYNIIEAIKELSRLQTADDYIKYGKINVLKHIKIHYNDVSFFTKNYDVIAIDSEGHYKDKYPVIIQFAVSEKEVYIFNVEMHLQNVLAVLSSNIPKIVFDLNAEKRAFKVDIQNTLDLQNGRESFVKKIYDTFNVSLKKNKKVHIQGWKADKLSKDQLYYSAFDVIWMYKIYCKLYNASNVNNSSNASIVNNVEDTMEIDC